MPQTIHSTKAEQAAILQAIEHLLERDKVRPTINDIVRRSPLTSKATRTAVSKMVREGLLFTEIAGRDEYIYPTKRIQ